MWEGGKQGRGRPGGGVWKGACGKGANRNVAVLAGAVLQAHSLHTVKGSVGAVPSLLGWGHPFLPGAVAEAGQTPGLCAARTRARACPHPKPPHAPTAGVAALEGLRAPCMSTPTVHGRACMTPRTQLTQPAESAVGLHRYIMSGGGSCPAVWSAPEPRREGAQPWTWPRGGQQGGRVEETGALTAKVACCSPAPPRAGMVRRWWASGTWPPAPWCAAHTRRASSSWRPWCTETAQRRRRLQGRQQQGRRRPLGSRSRSSTLVGSRRAGGGS